MENNFESADWKTASEIELVYKTKMTHSDRPLIRCSADLYKLFRDTWDETKIELLEQFKVLLINHAHRVLGLVEIASGGITDVPVDARLVFAAALKANAVYIAIAHNHPSGVTKPSYADEKLTQRLKQIGELLCISLLDHLIVCKDGFFSFADEGLI